MPHNKAPQSSAVLNITLKSLGWLGSAGWQVSLWVWLCLVGWLCSMCVNSGVLAEGQQLPRGRAASGNGKSTRQHGLLRCRFKTGQLAPAHRPLTKVSHTVLPRVKGWSKTVCLWWGHGRVWMQGGEELGSVISSPPEITSVEHLLCAIYLGWCVVCTFPLFF